MIDVKELKVGNYLKDKEGRKIVINRIEYESKNNSFINGKPIDCFIPIKLTKEILLEYGFEEYKEKDEVFFRNGDCFQLHQFNQFGDFSYICGDNLNGNFISTRIDFLHQLQNLYFILTGSELIK